MCRSRVSASPRQSATPAARSAVGTLALLALMFFDCGPAPRAPLDDDARRYVRLAAALGERDPDSLDFYAGPADVVADIRRNPPPLAAIKRDAGSLSAHFRARHDPDPVERIRVRTLVRDLSALIARVDLLTGTRLPYDRESVAFFGVAPGPIDERRLAGIRSQIAERVGHDGRLVDRYTAFAARFTVPADRLPQVMRAAIEECRRRTIAHVALPPEEELRLEFVRDKPWSAFSRYLGDARSVVQINTDFLFTVDQALQIACHEGYPGHHVRNMQIAPRRDSAGPPERSIQLMFSAEALESEASAMLAPDVAFPLEERVAFLRERLFPLAGLEPAGAQRHVDVERLVGELQDVHADVTRRYLDGALEFARAVSAFEEQALVPHAEALVKYINQFRSYVTTYTAGRQMLAARLAACAGRDRTDETRWRCFKTETLSVP